MSTPRCWSGFTRTFEVGELTTRGERPVVAVGAALRAAKQHRQLSYEELSFHLQDSLSFQSVARLSMCMAPKKSVLQRVISAIRAPTWERINERLKGSAREERFEPGKRIRIDSTVTDTPIYEPSDSSLLWDSVRVMSGLLDQACELTGATKLY